MALTETNRAEIRYLLGWPTRFFQDDTRLEGAMTALDSYTLSSGSTTQEARILANVTEAKTALADAAATTGVVFAVSKAGSIELSKARERWGHLTKARRCIREIAASLYVPVKVDITSLAAGRGDYAGGYLPWG